MAVLCQTGYPKLSLRIPAVWWVLLQSVMGCAVLCLQTVAVSQEKSTEPESGAVPVGEQEHGNSNSSSLSDRRLSSCSLCSVEEQHRGVYEMVQGILLSTRGYVNFVNEVFRQVTAHSCSLPWVLFLKGTGVRDTVGGAGHWENVVLVTAAASEVGLLPRSSLMVRFWNRCGS